MTSLDKITPFMHPQENPSSKPKPQSKAPPFPVKDRFSDKGLVTDKLSISAEAKNMGTEESSKEINRKAFHELATKAQGETAVDKDSEAEALERMIEELKEKIRDVTQQIATLEAQDNEAALEQQKALEVQLTVLNVQLMELMGQKIEMLDQKGW